MTVTELSKKLIKLWQMAEWDSLEEFLSEDIELAENAASKRDTLRLEMKCNKAVSLMKEISKLFKSSYSSIFLEGILTEKWS